MSEEDWIKHCNNQKGECYLCDEKDVYIDDNDYCGWCALSEYSE